MGIHFRIKFALQNCFTVLYRFTGIIYHKVKNTQYALHNLFWYAQWGYRNGGFLRAFFKHALEHVPGFGLVQSGKREKIYCRADISSLDISARQMHSV